MKREKERDLRDRKREKGDLQKEKEIGKWKRMKNRKKQR